jgi:vacuolar-type H+-ATPase subunit E/Vma4
LEVARIEERELEGHRAEIVADVENMIEKYRKIFDWDVPDIDQAAADRLILSEVRRALGELEKKLLG